MLLDCPVRSKCSFWWLIPLAGPLNSMNRFYLHLSARPCRVCSFRPSDLPTFRPSDLPTLRPCVHWVTRPVRSDRCPSDLRDVQRGEHHNLRALGVQQVTGPHRLLRRSRPEGARLRRFFPSPSPSVGRAFVRNPFFPYNIHLNITPRGG